MQASVGVRPRDRGPTARAATDARVLVPAPGRHRRVLLRAKEFPQQACHEDDEELLEPHRCYYQDLKPLLPLVKGLAHITGGGFEDNPPRILPSGLAVTIEVGSWTVPPIFSLIQKLGQVNQAEMYHVFNMGIGMVIICAKNNVSRLTKALPSAKVIGQVVPQTGEKRVIIKN